MTGTVYKRYLLSVLLVIYAFNSVDRAALQLVLQDIKSDFHLTDTQLGLLTGIVFALFYSLMGIRIARWADRGNRVTIISVCTALWSALVALCALAGNFGQLLLIRVGVAIGEAGCVPPAHSLIADYFTRAERPKAVAIYMLGASVSTVMGFFLAGWLNQFYGWRTMFVVLATPGLGLAVLAWLTLREPRTARLDHPQQATEVIAATPLKEVCVTLWSNRTFRDLLFYLSVASFFDFAILQWRPAFLIRSYGFRTGELGTWFAVIYGAAGMSGTYLGGVWASRYAPNNERRQLKAAAGAICGLALLSALVYLSPGRYLALGLIGLSSISAATSYGPVYGTVQTLVPEHMRATAIALIYLVSNLIGMGLGPLAMGALSDTLRPWAGEESLRYASLLLCPGYLWSAWLLWHASRTVIGDLSAARATHGQSHPFSDVSLKSPEDVSTVR
jgi:MFS family permease